MISQLISSKFSKKTGVYFAKLLLKFKRRIPTASPQLRKLASTITILAITLSTTYAVFQSDAPQKNSSLGFLQVITEPLLFISFLSEMIRRLYSIQKGKKEFFYLFIDTLGILPFCIWLSLFVEESTASLYLMKIFCIIRSLKILNILSTALDSLGIVKGLKALFPIVLFYWISVTLAFLIVARALSYGHTLTDFIFCNNSMAEGNEILHVLIYIRSGGIVALVYSKKKKILQKGDPSLRMLKLSTTDSKKLNAKGKSSHHTTTKQLALKINLLRENLSTLEEKFYKKYKIILELENHFEGLLIDQESLVVKAFELSENSSERPIDFASTNLQKNEKSESFFNSSVLGNVPDQKRQEDNKNNNLNHSIIHECKNDESILSEYGPDEASSKVEDAEFGNENDKSTSFGNNLYFSVNPLANIEIEFHSSKSLSKLKTIFEAEDDFSTGKAELSQKDMVSFLTKNSETSPKRIRSELELSKIKSSDNSLIVKKSGSQGSNLKSMENFEHDDIITLSLCVPNNQKSYSKEFFQEGNHNIKFFGNSQSGMEDDTKAGNEKEGKRMPKNLQTNASYPKPRIGID